jgi:hypothetical protein
VVGWRIYVKSDSDGVPLRVTVRLSTCGFQSKAAANRVPLRVTARLSAPGFDFDPCAALERRWFRAKAAVTRMD